MSEVEHGRSMEHRDGTSALRWLNSVSGSKKIYMAALLLVQVVLGISSVFYAVILRALVDAAVAGSRAGFFWNVVRLGGLALFQIVFYAIHRFLEEYSRATLENCFKSRLLAFLLREDYGKVTSVHSVEWMNRLTSDTVIVADGLTQILPGVAGMLVKMAGALVMLLLLVPGLCYLLIPGGVLLIILSWCFRKIMKRFHKQVQEADGRLRIFLQERLAGMLVIRAFVKEKQTLEETEELLAAHRKARLRKNHFSNLCNVGFGGVMNGAYVVGAGVCGYGILMGTMTYGTLMAVLQLIGQIQSPFANITGYLPRYYACLASAERLMEAEQFGGIAETEKVKTEDEMQKLYQNEFGGLILENAGFSYPSPVAGKAGDEAEVPESGRPPVLWDVSLSIKKGEYVAFTGASGCGKSTVLKLFLCLYPLKSGERYLELADGSRCPLTSAYRRLFAYVPQGNYLMSGSIRQVVAFHDAERMKEEMLLWRALSIACAETFVRDLPKGLDTVLGERGLGLSEGQMQRLAIARAVCAGNPILMLDESTSALDEATEGQLLENLRRMTDMTVLIVTHRPAALEICDREIAM